MERLWIHPSSVGGAHPHRQWTGGRPRADPGRMAPSRGRDGFFPGAKPSAEGGRPADRPVSGRGTPRLFPCPDGHALSTGGLGSAGLHPLWGNDHLRRIGPPSGPPEGGAGRGAGLRSKSAVPDPPLPPGDGRTRAPDRLCGRRRNQGTPAAAGGSALMPIFTYGETEIRCLKERDPVLGAAMDRIGPIRREVIPDLFEALVHSIVGQQIATKAQAAIWTRLKERFGILTPSCCCRWSQGRCGNGESLSARSSISGERRKKSPPGNWIWRRWKSWTTTLSAPPCPSSRAWAYGQRRCCSSFPCSGPTYSAGTIWLSKRAADAVR